MGKDDKQKFSRTLESALDKLKKKFGETAVFKGSENVITDVETIPTGSLALDAALLVGGLPRGRLIEFAGPEAGGKSFLSFMAIKAAQEQGLTCAFLDGEHTLDRNWLIRLGINFDDLIITRPEYLEDALNMMLSLAKTGEVDLIVLDSVPSLPTKLEGGKEIGEATVGTHAKTLTVALRLMTPVFNQNNVTGIFINQLREKIGVMFGDPVTTPGGRALKHHCSVRINIARVGSSEIKDDKKRPIGHRIRARVKKNKVSTAQNITAEFNIFYNEGIDWLDEILTVGIDTGVIERPSKVMYKVGGEQVKGKDALQEYLRENPEIVKELGEKVKEIIRTGVKTVPKAVVEPEKNNDNIDDQEFLDLEEKK